MTCVELLVWRIEPTCNMFFGLSHLFVYTNLVRGRMVGDSQSPLLRAIPVSGN